MRNKITLYSILFLTVTGCSTVTKEVVNEPKSSTQVSKTLLEKENKGLKRKVAIVRFSNETKHGNSFLLDKNNDRVGKQAMDILSARLSETGKFLMFERADLDKIKAEQDIKKINSKVVGADYLIVGSVSEFGRSTTSEVGIFSRNKKQKASATVNVRLVDVTTGQIVFSQEGSGEALSEANRVFGVGSSAGYNSKLDDQALSSAISKLISNLIENLLDRPWEAYILDSSSDGVIISGGKSQGIKNGDKFRVIKRGKQVENPQTGMMIELPGKEIALLEVVSLSGSGNNEISICNIISGNLNNSNFSQLIIREL